MTAHKHTATIRVDVENYEEVERKLKRLAALSEKVQGAGVAFAVGVLLGVLFGWGVL